MNIIARQKPKPIISAEEIERRREIVRRAVASSRIEGVSRDPEMDPVFEAYIRGDVDAREIVPRLNQLRAISRA